MTSATDRITQYLFQHPKHRIKLEYRGNGRWFGQLRYGWIGWTLTNQGSLDAVLDELFEERPR